MTNDSCAVQHEQAELAAQTQASLDARRRLLRVGRVVQRACYSSQLADAARLALAVRDPQQLLQQMTRVALEALRAEHASIYLIDPYRQDLRAVAGIGLHTTVGLPAPSPSLVDSLVGLVMRNGRSQVVADSPPGACAAQTLAIEEGPLRSAMAAPLLDGGSVIGVFVVGTLGERAFASEEVCFLETLSGLLAANLLRARSEVALVHSEALKSVGQLTAGIAHEFNNILAVISGNLQVLEEMPAITGNARLQAISHVLEHAAKRGRELTGTLLGYSRRSVPRSESVDVGAILHRLADALSRTMGHGIRVTADVSPHCHLCSVDPGELESALLNVAINARDAMPGGGTLRLSARSVDHVPPDTGVRWLTGAQCGYVAIAIDDTGIGMSEAVKRRAVEPFFTTKDSGRGTGLGLSTVRALMDRSHGAMLIDSAVGIGTTVTLFLPRNPA